MAAMNKRLLIFESHDDSNRCTPYRGKHDQHATCIPRLVCVWSKTIRISHGQHISIFHTVVNKFEHIQCPREEWLLTQYTARRLTELQVRTQPLSHNSQWSIGEKSSFCWQPTTRLTGPINTIMWSVRSILAHGYQPLGLQPTQAGATTQKPWDSHNTLSVLPFWVFHWSP
jgi:hypothetical protein